MDNELNDINEEIIINEKKKRGPKNKYEKGYADHYMETKYFNNYYHANKEKIACSICNKMTNGLKMKEHQRSQKCMRVNNIINALD